MKRAGVLLTGGRSTRMCVDKAALRVPMIGGHNGKVETEKLAERTGQSLHEETDIAVEAGSGLPRRHGHARAAIRNVGTIPTPG